MKDIASVAIPLKNNSGNQETTEKMKSFDGLKKHLTSSPVLALLRNDKPVVLDTDGYAEKLGCTLLQQEEDNSYVPLAISALLSSTLRATTKKPNPNVSQSSGLC